MACASRAVSRASRRDRPCRRANMRALPRPDKNGSSIPADARTMRPRRSAVPAAQSASPAARRSSASASPSTPSAEPRVSCNVTPESTVRRGGSVRGKNSASTRRYALPKLPASTAASHRRIMRIVCPARRAPCARALFAACPASSARRLPPAARQQLARFLPPCPPSSARRPPACPAAHKGRALPSSHAPLHRASGRPSPNPGFAAPRLPKRLEKCRHILYNGAAYR